MREGAWLVIIVGILTFVGEVAFGVVGLLLGLIPLPIYAVERWMRER